MCLYLNALHNLSSISTCKESREEVIGTRRSKERHRVTVYTVTRTKRWRNVMLVLHKSVNGFKDFPRADSRSQTENPLCIVRSVHFIAPLSNLLVLPEANHPLFPLKSDRLHIIGGADKLGAGIVRSVTNINWSRPTNERSATHVIGFNYASAVGDKAKMNGARNCYF